MEKRNIWENYMNIYMTNVGWVEKITELLIQNYTVFPM